MSETQKPLLIMFYAVLYNRHSNHFARFALSAANEASAAQEAVVGVGPGYRLSTLIPLCRTTDMVHLEI
jgi:hypothetical protein